MVGLGGGALVYRNEKKLRGTTSAKDEHQRTKDGRRSTDGDTWNGVAGFPKEISELLPQLLQLNPIGLHALNRILENPEEANQLLHILSRLDPDLIRQLRNLDRDARALLLAMAGN
jgi:hypothetical protein